MSPSLWPRSRWWRRPRCTWRTPSRRARVQESHHVLWEVKWFQVKFKGLYNLNSNLLNHSQKIYPTFHCQPLHWFLYDQSDIGILGFQWRNGTYRKKLRLVKSKGISDYLQQSSMYVALPQIMYQVRTFEVEPRPRIVFCHGGNEAEMKKVLRWCLPARRKSTDKGKSSTPRRNNARENSVVAMDDSNRCVWMSSAKMAFKVVFSLVTGREYTFRSFGV